MITEAEIQSINYASNSCTVRIPIFETTNSISQVVLEAKVLIQPGIYNCYEVGDRVWVGFADNQPGKPIVIGKIFNNAKDESVVSGGAINCASLKVSDNCTLPRQVNINNSDTNFDSVEKIINNIKTLQQETGEIYSQAEQAIGQWVDGKIIYRKTLIRDVTHIGGTEFSEIFDLSGLNYDLIWVDSSHTFIVGTVYCTGASYYKNEQDWFYTYIRQSNKDLIAAGIPVSGNTITKIIVTIQYTKK